MKSDEPRAPLKLKKRPTKKTGTLFLIVGPSRVGKDSIMAGVLRRKSLKLKKLVTVTTRECRPNEVPGKSYHYVSEAGFDKWQKSGQLLEWAPVRGYKFGTPKEPLLSWLKKGERVIQQVDVRGATALSKIKALNVFSIFILPGDLNDLKKRLNTQHFSPAQRKIRWQETLDEISRQKDFDFRVVNKRGHLQEAINEVAQVIEMVR
jgi:guanylate kinase